jgi:hypothetical protein
MTRAIWLSYKSFAVFFLLIAFGANGSYGQSYGLAFASYEIFQNQRTGIDLSQGKDSCHFYLTVRLTSVIFSELLKMTREI